MPKKVRNYREEYDSYHKRPEQRKRRSMRNQARRKAGLTVGDGKEADHKTPLSKGGGNSKSNISVKSRAANRKKYDK